MTSNELDDLFADHSKSKKQYPWSSIWDAAESYSSKAFEETLSFEESNESNLYYEKAMILYKESADLGCLMAYEKLGDIYKEGQGVYKDYQKAIEYYKEGVNKGNYYCYSGIADIFIKQTNTEKFHKSYVLLFRDRNTKINTELEELNGGDFWLYCFRYINACFELGLRPSKETVQDMSELKYKITDHILGLISFDEGTEELLAETEARLEVSSDMDYQTSISIQKIREEGRNNRKKNTNKLREMQDWINENL